SRPVRGRRQATLLATPHAAALPRCAPRRPLDYDAPPRPLRPDRRLRRDDPPDARRAPLLPAEVARRGARPVRLLARPARPEDAGRADAEALRERACDRGLPRPPPAGREGALPRAADAPGPRDRRAADARLRRGGLGPL